MWPVVGDELFGNHVGLNDQRRAVVLAILNADVRNREQQGILVSGGELPFTEQALDVAQELECCCGSTSITAFGSNSPPFLE